MYIPASTFDLVDECADQLLQLSLEMSCLTPSFTIAVVQPPFVSGQDIPEGFPNHRGELAMPGGDSQMTVPIMAILPWPLALTTNSSLDTQQFCNELAESLEKLLKSRHPRA